MRLNTLIITDLHMGDNRNDPADEARNLRLIEDTVKKHDIGVILDLGDSVSKPSLIREGEDYFHCFNTYLDWRKTLGVPVLSCAIDREYEFFAELTGQPMDHCRDVLPDLTVITLAPRYENGHTFSADQIDFLEDCLKKSRKRVLIGTHIPYPGSCSRPVAPGIFLGIPGPLRMMLETCDREIFWAGGHFHWGIETPVKTGSLTSLIAGRFMLRRLPALRTTYMTVLTADNELYRVTVEDL